LLARAQAAFSSGRLAEPRGDNALELVLQVLQVRPDDAAARDLETRASNALETRARDAEARQEVARAIEIYQRLADLYPNRAIYQQEIDRLGAPPVPDISGTWRHLGTVLIKADGTCEYHTMFFVHNNGRWSCLDPRKRLFRFIWDSGYVDTVTLGEDGRSLFGTNNEGKTVTYLKK
jgi:tetratricopeptide (TPR) repeat protein